MDTVEQFRKEVKAHFDTHGRDLPWRRTRDPYAILVSEIMLQQTQVERVIPKYFLFLKTFPTIQDLARASLGDVLRLWSGLGYNRRAKLLYVCAKEVMGKYAGALPKEYSELLSLPGIGPYTAGAITAFAYNKPLVMIETNIRAVYLHCFFRDKEDVSDRELLPLIEKTLDRKNPRLWYNMLMDYGSFIKHRYGNPNRKSTHHVVQKKFKGSNRQIRGKILHLLVESKRSKKFFIRVAGIPAEVFGVQIKKLEREGLVAYSNGAWSLP